MEETRKKKRQQTGVMMANDDRPRSGAPRRAKQDDAMRSLLPDAAHSQDTSKPPSYGEHCTSFP